MLLCIAKCQVALGHRNNSYLKTNCKNIAHNKSISHSLLRMDSKKLLLISLEKRLESLDTSIPFSDPCILTYDSKRKQTQSPENITKTAV